MSLGRDGFAGLILLAISLVLLVQAVQLPSPPIVPVGPGFYPSIVLVFTAAMSALLVVQDWRRRRERERPRDSAGARSILRRYGRVAILFAIVAAYVGLLPALGFRIATALFVAAAQATIEPPRSARAWAVLAAVAVGTAAATYLAFQSYLLVLLPRGTWTGW